VLWNQQLAATYNAELAGPRGGALHLDHILAAQGELFDRQLARWEGRLPRGLWVMLYDHLRGVWLDEGTRSLEGRLDLGADEPADLLPVLAHNWARPETNGPVSFRRVRERRARLRVPIRSVSDFVLTARVRSEVPVLPQALRLEVNGRATGAVPVPGEWAEVSFAVPAAWLHPGYNDVELVFAASTGDVRPDARREFAAAVDWIAFTRTTAR
jgi:hypothetical protein